MGGICSGGTTKDKGRHGRGSSVSKKLEPVAASGQDKNVGSYEYPSPGAPKKMPDLYFSGELLSISGELKTNKAAPQASSFLGKAGTAGLERAVEVLDSLGSSVTNLNNSGFISGTGRSRGNRISILAFEVANTISKGATLSQSLSQESIRRLKEEILHLKAVQELVSTDTQELLTIAAADKREEFDVFSREVVRFGNMCKDPQWHHLDRYFSKLDSDPVNNKKLMEEDEMTLQELATLAEYTSELYHELHALDRFEQDYRRQIDELVSSNLPRKGESLEMLHIELKKQRKTVRGLKKKSIWSKVLEEVVEKLVDIVASLHHKFINAFGDSGLTYACNKNSKGVERLGPTGLSLHYANLITKIDNLASCPTSLPPNTRDALYKGLPSTVKASLRSQLQSQADTKEELTVPQIRAEMEKILIWLLPAAIDTTKSHQGFGWVGEWANTGNECGRKEDMQKTNLTRLQTLYHAEKHKMDSYILELVMWLHRLICLMRFNGPTRGLATGRSSTDKRHVPGTATLHDSKPKVQVLDEEDETLLEGVMQNRKLVVPAGLSRSEELVKASSNNGGNDEKVRGHSRSAGSSPCKLETPKDNALDILVF
ncbi:unnamed protein product [Cuscuta campestris]|uniref:DUF668 domain-containing protein n=1 Tax=Cuscuta campestris TaxID=132261 RepID=A0A484LZD2_9ASTE|nr:unnamed protein product [Cuscuta campestris]